MCLLDQGVAENLSNVTILPMAHSPLRPVSHGVLILHLITHVLCSLRNMKFASTFKPR